MERVESLEKILEKQGKELVTVSKLTIDMKEGKLEASRFESLYKELNDTVNTVKYAVQDTFRQLLGTDNYL